MYNILVYAIIGSVKLPNPRMCKCCIMKLCHADNVTLENKKKKINHHCDDFCIEANQWKHKRHYPNTYHMPTMSSEYKLLPTHQPYFCIPMPAHTLQDSMTKSQLAIGILSCLHH